MSLSNFGMNRRQLRQGGGRGTGSDHVEELMGATELYIYQTPNTRPKGYTGLKTFLEAQHQAQGLYRPEDLPRGPGVRDYLHRRRAAGVKPVRDHAHHPQAD